MPRSTKGAVKAPPRTSQTERESLLGLLNTMCLIRAFEERVSALVPSGTVVGLVHVSTGQEAVAAGVCAHLRDGDTLFTGHRAHGHFLARGADPDRVMAELMGRADGLCRGKGGSMHLVEADLGLLGATGVVGGNTAMAVGTALASKDRGTDAVTVVFFGDGAAQAGLFHEALNLASLWEAPVLFVCENNGYAEFTPRSAHTRVEHVTSLTQPYDIPWKRVDGNDVLAVWEAAGELVAKMRASSGPAMLECLTYRLRGHYEGEPTGHRAAEELAEWRAKDPIQRLAKVGLRDGWLTDEELQQAEERARERVDAAVAFGQASPWPSLDELQEDVYA